MKMARKEDDTIIISFFFILLSPRLLEFGFGILDCGLGPETIGLSGLCLSVPEEDAAMRCPAASADGTGVGLRPDPDSGPYTGKIGK
jgi:hypothetical protein